MVDRVFEARKNLLGDSCIVAVVSASGSGSTEEVQSLNFQGENPRSSLNWLCLTMAC